MKRPLTEECKILECPSQRMHLAAQMSPTPRPINDGQHHCRSQILSSERYLDPPVRHRLQVTQGGPAVWHLAGHTYDLPPLLSYLCQQWHTTPRSVMFLCVCLCVCPPQGGVELSLGFSARDDVRRLLAVDGETPRPDADADGLPCRTKAFDPVRGSRRDAVGRQRPEPAVPGSNLDQSSQPQAVV